MVPLKQAREKLSELNVYLMQDEFEFDRLLFYYHRLSPKITLEIGSWNGGSLYCFSLNSPKNSLLISIDLDTNGSSIIRNKVFDEIRHTNHQVKLIENPSEKSVKILKDLLQNQLIDFLFIDGNHGYANRDYDLYQPFVRKGGIIAFHDIMYECGDIFSAVKKIGLEKFTVICGQKADMGVAFMVKE